MSEPDRIPADEDAPRISADEDAPRIPANEDAPRIPADEDAPRILVAGVGNIFMSDDGFGSAVAGELASRDLPPDVRVVDYGIRGLHLAFDLTDEVELLILADTVPHVAGGPGAIAIIEAEPGTLAAGASAIDAHSMDPNAVFASLAALGQAAPRIIVVGCQPLTIADGIGLSPVVSDAVPKAADTICEMLQQLHQHAGEAG